MTERVAPEVYHRVFEGHHEGVLILEDLVARFYDVDVFVKGGAEGARATDYKAGQRATVQHILTMLGQVRLDDPNEADPPAA